VTGLISWQDTSDRVNEQCIAQWRSFFGPGLYGQHRDIC
jgi:hypothetical protein